MYPWKDPCILKDKAGIERVTEEVGVLSVTPNPSSEVCAQVADPPLLLPVAMLDCCLSSLYGTLWWAQRLSVHSLFRIIMWRPSWVETSSLLLICGGFPAWWNGWAPLSQEPRLGRRPDLRILFTAFPFTSFATSVAAPLGSASHPVPAAMES